MADDEDPRVRSKSRSPTEEVVQVKTPYIFHKERGGGLKVLNMIGAKTARKLDFDAIDQYIINMQEQNGGTYFLIFDEDFAISPNLNYVFVKTAYNNNTSTNTLYKFLFKKYGIAISDEPSKNVFGYFFAHEKNTIVKRYLNAVNIGNIEIVTNSKVGYSYSK